MCADHPLRCAAEVPNAQAPASSARQLSVQDIEKVLAAEESVGWRDVG